jgi:hypothetical protein
VPAGEDAEAEEAVAICDFAARSERKSKSLSMKGFGCINSSTGKSLWLLLLGFLGKMPWMQQS